MPISLPELSAADLLLSLTPVAVMGIFYWKWSLRPLVIGYATIRMITQLFLLGIVLAVVFKTHEPFTIFGIFILMLSVAAWTCLYPIQQKRKKLLPIAFVSLLTGCGCTVITIVLLTVEKQFWQDPRFFIPVIGMALASAMNTVSLAAERFENEVLLGRAETAKSASLRAAMIPNTNMFLTVGLVSIPGVMTGQILAGVDPLLSIRYQVLIMSMIFGSSGLSAVTYLQQVSKKHKSQYKNPEGALVIPIRQKTANDPKAPLPKVLEH